MVSGGELGTLGAVNFTVVIASAAVIFASSTLVLFLCAICRRYSMDFTDYDKNNTQVIYNVSAGAKELPSTYTMGAYRGYQSEFKGPIITDTVLANPAAVGVENSGYSSPQLSNTNHLNAYDDDDDGSLTYHNAAFMNKSP